MERSAIQRERSPFVFGLAYMAFSMGLEIALIVLGRLRVPEDNAIIAPIILMVSPIAAGWFCGYRTPKRLAILTCATAAVTVLCVLLFSRLTGISTGVGAPILIRTIAGAFAAKLTALR